MSKFYFHLEVSTDGPCVEECLLATGKSEAECKSLCSGRLCFWLDYDLGPTHINMC